MISLKYSYLKECCYPYWRDSNVVQFGEYFVKVELSNEYDGYIEKMLYIHLDKDGPTQYVLQIQVTDWPQDGAITEPRVVLQVLNKVLSRQQEDNPGPVVVHCR